MTEEKPIIPDATGDVDYTYSDKTTEEILDLVAQGVIPAQKQTVVADKADKQGGEATLVSAVIVTALPPEETMADRLRTHRETVPVEQVDFYKNTPSPLSGFEEAMAKARGIPGLNFLANYARGEIEDRAFGYASEAYSQQTLSPEDMRDPMATGSNFSYEARRPVYSLSAGSKEINLPGGLSAAIKWDVGMDGAVFDLRVPLQSSGGKKQDHTPD